MSEKRFDTAYAARELNDLGLDTEEIIGAWVAGSVTNQTTLESNLKTIRDLNRAEKGSPELLSREFGIRNFGRYPVATLLAQIEERNNIQDESVVWLAAEFDPQAELYKLAGRVGVFHKGLGEGVKLRILESDSAERAADRLTGYRDRYYPIEKSVWVAHGYDEGMVMGEGSEINKMSLSADIGQTIKAAYAARSSSVLLSCRTGTEGGFAQDFSGLLRSRVQAPKHRTSLEVIRLEGPLHDRDLNVTYTTDTSMRHRDYALFGDKAVYERGQLVSA